MEIHALGGLLHAPFVEQELPQRLVGAVVAAVRAPRQQQHVRLAGKQILLRVGGILQQVVDAVLVKVENRLLRMAAYAPREGRPGLR